MTHKRQETEAERNARIVKSIPTMIHDVRKPIANADALSEILLTELLGEMSPEELTEKIERGEIKFEDPRNLAYLIRESAKYGCRLTSNLLDLDLLDGKKKHEITGVDFRVGVMPGVVSMYSHGLRHRFNESYNSDGEVLVKGNELLLKRLMTNLIDNALKYSDKKSKLRFHGEKKKDFYEFFMENEHPGFGREQTESMFNGDRLGQMTGGFGIGLGNCRRIVEDIHGGKIWAESEPGHVRMKFTLPEYKEE